MRINDWSSDVCSSDLQDLDNTTRIYWWREPLHGGWIYGPYVNHNHYAGFINMLALMPLALVLGRTVRRDKQLGRASCWGRSVAVRVAIWGSRIIKTKISIHKNQYVRQFNINKC